MLLRRKKNIIQQMNWLTLHLFFKMIWHVSSFQGMTTRVACFLQCFQTFSHNFRQYMIQASVFCGPNLPDPIFPLLLFRLLLCLRTIWKSLDDAFVSGSASCHWMLFRNTKATQKVDIHINSNIKNRENVVPVLQQMSTKRCYNNSKSKVNLSP